VDGFLNLSLAEIQQVPPELILILKLSRAMARKNADIMRNMDVVTGHLKSMKTEIRRFSANVAPADAIDDQKRQQKEAQSPISNGTPTRLVLSSLPSHQTSPTSNGTPRHMAPIANSSLERQTYKDSSFGCLS